MNHESCSASVKNAVIIASGGLSGGISSTIAGGNFWAGARQGLITSGLNHVAHMGMNIISYRQMLKDNGYSLKGEIEVNKEYAIEMINRIQQLESDYNAGERPNITITQTTTSDFGEYKNIVHTVYLNKARIHTNYKLLSTMSHEFRHAWQWRSGTRSFIKAMNPTKDINIWAEMDAYRYQMNHGDYSANTWAQYLKYSDYWKNF